MKTKTSKWNEEGLYTDLCDSLGLAVPGGLTGQVGSDDQCYPNS